MLKIIDFIKSNKNWKTLLSGHPYNLLIKENDYYYKFNYSQIESDFSKEMVQEARGLIVNKSTLDVVSMSFKKFFNYGEGFAADIDWKTSRILEKVDGSIISIFYDRDKWNIVTNGTLNAFDAPVSMPMNGINNFGELFMDALEDCKSIQVIEDIKNNTTKFLRPENTYIFELVSLLTRVVIQYDKNAIYHIGTRNNNTLQELEVELGIQKPKSYNFNSLEECIEATKKLIGEEGYVVVDENYNRIKIKSIEYLTMHRCRTNGVLTKKRIWELICTFEHEEYLSYFKDEEKYFLPALEIYNKTKEDFSLIKNEVISNKDKFETRKSFVEWAKSNFDPIYLPFVFYILDGKDNTLTFTKMLGKVGETKWLEKDSLIVNL